MYTKIQLKKLFKFFSMKFGIYDEKSSGNMRFMELIWKFMKGILNVKYLYVKKLVIGEELEGWAFKSF